MNSVSGQQAAASFIGQRVKQATSSLESMSIEFDGGKGLLLLGADGASGQAALSIRQMEAEHLPRQADAVCSVDWSWIQGSALTRATVNDGNLKLELDPAGPLTVSVQLWQGKPFLAFQPYKPAK
jgi:hypothetical protein